MNESKEAIMIDRFVASTTWRLEEQAYGHHDLADYGIKLELAWMSDTPGVWTFELSADRGEGRVGSALIEHSGSPAEARAALAKGYSGIFAE